jgi:hypothetical protein
MLAPVKSKKMSAEFGGIARNFGGIARNFGGITRTQHWLQICTAHENPISAELKIVGNFFCFRQKCEKSAIPVLKCNFGRSSEKGFPRYRPSAWHGAPSITQRSHGMTASNMSQTLMHVSI